MDLISEISQEKLQEVADTVGLGFTADQVKESNLPSCFNYNAQDNKKGKKLTKTLKKFYIKFELNPSFLKGK